MWTAKTLTGLGGCPGWLESSLGAHAILLYPATQKVARYYVIPSENFGCPSVCLSVLPPISASFPDYNLSSFWPIFFKRCTDIDIGEEWLGIANGLNSFINNRVMALDWCKNVIAGLRVVFDWFFSNFAWTLISGRRECFGIANVLNLFINNRVMALDWCKRVFFLNIFRTNGWILIDKYKIHVVSHAHCFWSIFNRVMALDRRQIFVYAQYLVN